MSQPFGSLQIDCIFFEAFLAKLGNVACLAGPVIYVRLSFLLEVWDSHVRESVREHPNLHQHWLHTFGEDCHLTQRLGARFGPGSTGMLTGTVSETEPAVPLADLLLQRRRWFLGAVATEAAYLCKADFWRSTPWLSAYRRKW
ncbi:hypothetical protein INS49_011904 [Diaporthe citri]|uniref:uncharacterized protein n=1 Tax=Diaporthe citri TaxID=83186 RepID=UPI001C7F9774|nr:uncharacterized protein INS49_011904 [Diaporthe citri]KAG6360837.1 hypothetical protein INS49_011904 [Diaporthe citri]